MTWYSQEIGKAVRSKTSLAEEFPSVTRLPRRPSRVERLMGWLLRIDALMQQMAKFAAKAWMDGFAAYADSYYGPWPYDSNAERPAAPRPFAGRAVLVWRRPEEAEGGREHFSRRVRRPRLYIVQTDRATGRSSFKLAMVAGQGLRRRRARPRPALLSIS